MFMVVLPGCVYVHYVCTWCLRRLEEGIRALLNWSYIHIVVNQCWEANLGPLLEQQVLTAKLSLQPLNFLFQTGFHVLQASLVFTK